MKIKFLAALGLAAAIGAVGCKSAANTNTATMNTNTAVATATPVVKTTEAATTDTNLKSKVDAALKAKGFTDLTLDTTTTRQRCAEVIRKQEWQKQCRLPRKRTAANRFRIKRPRNKSGRKN